MRGIRQAMLLTLHTAMRQATSFLGRTEELRSRTSTVSDPTAGDRSTNL